MAVPNGEGLGGAHPALGLRLPWGRIDQLPFIGSAHLQARLGAFLDKDRPQ